MPDSDAGRRIIRGLVALVLLGALLLQGGCSALRFAYNQAPDLAYWWLDGYVDFDGEQTHRVREALAGWFRWHRHTQLPEYAALLARAEADVQQPATAAQACRWGDQIRDHIRAALEQALPAMAEIALTITPEQIAHLEKRQAKNNEDFRDDFLQPDPAKRLDASVARTLDRLEMLYGRFDDAQRTQLVRGLQASPFDPEVWLAERRARQLDLVALLRQFRAERSTPAQAQAALQGLIDAAFHSPRIAYRDYEEQLTRYNCRFAAELHNSTSLAQRQAALQRLQGWEHDLRILAAESK